MTDMDLWVMEPSGKKTYIFNPLTEMGGLMLSHSAAGYGPDEYLLRTAQPGSYKVMVEYFGSNAPALLGAVTIQVDFYINFGRENEEWRSVTMRLSNPEDVISVGEIEF